MVIKYQVKKEVDPKEIEKFKLKMFRRKRKDISFVVGEVVSINPDNFQYVTESKRESEKYNFSWDNRKFGYDDSNPGHLKKGTIQWISATKIKLAEMSYPYSKQIFEKCEN